MIVGENVPIGFGDGEITTEADLAPVYGPELPSEPIPGLVTQQELYTPSAAPSAPIPGLVTQRDLYAPSATPSAPIPGLVTQQQFYAQMAPAAAPAPAPVARPVPAAPAAPRGAAGRPAGKPAQGGARGAMPMPQKMMMPQGGGRPQGAFAASGGGMFDSLPPWAPYAMLAGGVVLATVILALVIPKSSTPSVS